MRNIEVSAKTVDLAIEKGLQMLGVERDEVEVKVINEGSMLKKAVVEIYTFANAEEKEEYLKNNKKVEEIKLVKNSEEESTELPPVVGLLCHMAVWGFPGGSDGKESACSAGDLGLIPGSG